MKGIMRTREIISKVKKWRDFYGGDIPDRDAINAIKSKEDAYKILENHRTLMENTLSDAMSDLDKFERELRV